MQALNYLAHLCLADGSPDSIAGNFLGDFVKGRPEDRFPAAVVRGIRLHRAIDSFTDAHPLVRRAVDRIDPARRRYAGIAIDMAFDHFLARVWAERDPTGFFAARQHAYAVLRARHDEFPERLRAILPRLTDDDWLGSYAQFDAIAHALERMSLRLRRPNALATTADDIERHYDALEADFHAYWPEARAFAAAEQRRLARILPDMDGTTEGHGSTRIMSRCTGTAERC